jgi:hypothetical protein
LIRALFAHVVRLTTQVEQLQDDRKALRERLEYRRPVSHRRQAECAAIDETRAAESRWLVQDGYEPVLKKSRWCLLKCRKNLTGKQRIKLRDVFRYNLQNVCAYLLKEYFHQFWDYDSPAWAGKFLDRWRPASHTLEDRTAEEIRRHSPRSPRTVAQLFSGAEGVLQRHCRRTQQRS